MKEICLVGLLVLCGSASTLGESTNRMSPEELRQVHLPDVVLESVKPVTPDPEKNPRAAAYIEVKGVIGGTIRFELLLPDGKSNFFPPLHLLLLFSVFFIPGLM